MTRGLAVLLAVAAVAPRITAAQDGTQLVDRIVAIVGLRAILLSELEEEFVQAQAQAQGRNQPFPTDSAERMSLRRELLVQMVEQEILVQEAQRDTGVRVTDQEVQEQVEQTVQNVRRGFTSEQEFQRRLREAQFGSVEEWRRFLAGQQRRQIFVQRLMEVRRQSGKLKSIPASEQQLREYFDANQGGGQDRPAVVSFRQIVVPPMADSAARARGWALAESLLVALRAGGDFAEAARRFSDDSTTREAGGELGCFRRGVMFKEFEWAAFSTRPGQLAGGIVETPYGFHVIKVVRAEPAEVCARHILITPALSPERIAAARQLAESIRVSLANGASFDSLARRHADPNESKLADSWPVANLPPDYKRAIGDSGVGLRPMFALGESTARPKFVVLEVTARREAGAVRFEDVRDRIRQVLGQQLALQHYVSQLRRHTYVDVRF